MQESDASFFDVIIVLLVWVLIFMSGLCEGGYISSEAFFWLALIDLTAIGVLQEGGGYDDPEE